MLNKFTLKKPSRKVCIGIIIVCSVIGIIWGNKNAFFKQTAKPVSSPIEVQAMKVIIRDTPVNSEYVGKVVSQNDISVNSKVSGNIVQKMVKGGDVVSQGEVLFQIDDKQYRSQINSAKGTLA